ncbi:MAG: type IV pilus secretin PilQ [Nitrospirota bacterium]
MIIKAFVIMVILSIQAISGFAGEADTPSISLKREETMDVGSRYSLEFRDADLKDVLRALAQENGFNIIIGEDVAGRLTLSFKNVSLMEALDAILRINNLTRLQESGIIRVIKSPFPEGEGDLVTKIIPISFASAKESSETLKGILSKKGSISVDSRTNSIIVRDVPGNIEKISEIMRGLDSKTPQVLIEARIVEVNTNFTRELGVQWGGNLSQSTSLGTFQATGATSGSTTPTALTGGVGLSGNNFIVNLPANVSSGHGGALGLLFGNISNTFQLDLQLSAMEDRGHGKILSNPKVLTLNNKEAKISSGTEILIPTATIVGAGTGTTGGTTGVTTINAKLELTVTPHVTPDNQIVMHVKTDKKDPDFNRQVQGIPPLSTRTAETDLLVEDGETIVIGGIFTRSESSSEAGVPWLSNIPLLGWLFKKEAKVENQNELLIFITPTIYKDRD